MGYTFDRFLELLGTNWYDDDPVLQRLEAHYTTREDEPSPSTLEPELHQWGGLCAGTLRELAEESALVENRPRLRHFDAYRRRVDEIVLPGSTERALRIAGGEHRLGALHGDPHVFTAKWYLCLQNGEAGVGCSLACTEGMVRALEKLGDQPVHAEALRRLRHSSVERYVHGAQFVTEIQGGSDAATNQLAARQEGGNRWALHGQKWFCSNINADYFLVTGRPEGAGSGGRGIALFLVPAYLDEERRVRNGYTIDRLKDKLGTRELATAEVTFSGAEAHPLGPLDHGLANVVSLVLVTSRFACLVVAAAFLRQAERIAQGYAEFRHAFGRRLSDFPLIQETLASMRGAREHSLASVFELMRMWQAAGADESSTESVGFRCLLSLCKPALTRQATMLLHEGIMLLGGNGIEERFSPLPRLWRDSIVMETWEGPHNVLITQAVRDLRRYGVDPAAFVAWVAGEARQDLSRELGRILARGSDEEAAAQLARLGPDLVRAFSERALGEAMARRE